MSGVVAIEEVVVLGPSVAVAVHVTDLVAVTEVVVAVRGLLETLVAGAAVEAEALVDVLLGRADEVSVGAVVCELAVDAVDAMELE
jgi:hypothetical protein